MCQILDKPDNDTLKSFFNSLSIFSSSKTMKCHGYLKQQNLIMIIYSGNKYNFIDP